MYRCQYPRCSNYYEIGGPKSFFRVPDSQRASVVALLNIPDHLVAIRICEDHFEPGVFVKHGRLRYLRRDVSLDEVAQRSAEERRAQEPGQPEPFRDKIARYTQQFKAVTEHMQEQEAALKREKQAALDLAADRDHERHHRLRSLATEHGDQLFANLVRLHEIENQVLAFVGQDEDSVKAGVPDDLIKFISQWNHLVLSKI